MIKGAMNMGMSAADVDAALPKGYSIPAAQAQKTSGFKTPFDQPASATNTATGFTPSSNKLFQDEFSEDVDGGVDTLTMGIPLFIRMLEYAREEAQTDADLHHVTKKMMDMGGNVTMDDYDEIMSVIKGDMMESNAKNDVADNIMFALSATGYNMSDVMDALEELEKANKLTDFKHGYQATLRYLHNTGKKEVAEAPGGALDDTAYGGADKTVTPSVNGFSQSRDLNTGSYTDRYDNGAMQVSKTYDKSGQQTGQSAAYRMGDKTISRSQDASGHSGKDITVMGNDRRIDSYKGQDANSLKQTGTEYERRYWDDNTNTKGWEKASTHGTTDDGRHKSTFYPKRKGVTYADSNTQANANKLFQDQHSEMRKLAGLATEDYVGGREAPADLIKSLSKSYKDFVKEVEQQNAAKPDRELRSKTEKPRKFGNILGEE
jgi:hypothetical protein